MFTGGNEDDITRFGNFQRRPGCQVIPRSAVDGQGGSAKSRRFADRLNPVVQRPDALLGVANIADGQIHELFDKF